jgi:hypothetical protein
MKSFSTSAVQVLSALAEKHKQDLFVGECKNGSTWADSHLRLDAWVLLRTWSPWTTIGYEIKVSRQDFENDQKWGGYLPVCHSFYFVCPAGLIKAVDLPSGVGLIWMSQTGNLHTKVKAERKVPDPQKLLQLMTYVLMSRSVIVNDMHEANAGKLPDTPEKKIERYREYISMAKDKKELAFFVNEHVRAQYGEMADRCARAELLHEQAMSIIKHLRERGIKVNADDYCWQWNAMRQVDEIVGHIETQQVTDLLGRAAQAIASVRDQIDKMTAVAKSTVEKKSA